MSLFTRFRSTLAQLKGVLFGPESTVGPAGAQMLSGVLGWQRAPARGTRELLEAYKSLPFLHSIVRRIAEDVATVPWEVYAPASRRRGKSWYRHLASVPEHGRQKLLATAVAQGDLQRVEEHPFLTLLTTMNPALGGFDSWVAVGLYLDLIGQAPLMRDNGLLGPPTQLWPVPPTWVAEVPDATHPRFRVSYGNWYRDLAEREMLWLRAIDPENPYGRGTGYGPAMADEMDVAELRARYEKNFFFNDATPSAIVKLGQATLDEATRLKEALTAEHRGPGRNGRMHVTNRDLQYQQLQPPMRDIQFAEMNSQSRDIILEVFQFPRELLGLRDGTNRATINTAEYLYMKGVVVPRKERMRSALQQVLAEYDERLVLGFHNPVPEDMEAQRAHMVAVPATVRVNEHRRAQGLEPLPGTEGEELYVPPETLASSFGPLGLAAGAGDPPWALALPVAEMARLNAQARQHAKLPPGVRTPKTPPRAEPYTPCAPGHEAWCEQLPVTCVRCDRGLGCHFEPQPFFCHACAAVEDGQKGTRPPRLPALVQRSTASALEALRPEQLTEAVAPVEEAEFLRWAEAALRELGLEPRFDMRNPLVRQRLEQYAGERIRLITTTTLEALREELGAGVAAGEGIGELKRRVEDVFDAAEGYRAERIARTEVVGLSNAANLEAFRQSGVVSGKEWLSVRGANTRDSHRALDGQQVPLDAPFTVPGTDRKAQHPGGFGLAEEDCNCMCTALPVVDGAKAVLRTLSEDEKAAVWRRFDAALADSEQRMLEAFKAGFREQRRRVLAAL